MNIYIYVLVMAVSTYLIRAIPLTLFKKPIRSRFLRSFLHYVPPACLSAMTFPAILYSSGTTLDGPVRMVSGALGLLVGVLLAFKNKSLIVVALASCATVFLCDLIIALL